VTSSYHVYHTLPALGAGVAGAALAWKTVKTEINTNQIAHHNVRSNWLKEAFFFSDWVIGKG
jgi:hypothetical protein